MGEVEVDARRSSGSEIGVLERAQLKRRLACSGRELEITLNDIGPGSLARVRDSHRYYVAVRERAQLGRRNMKSRVGKAVPECEERLKMFDLVVAVSDVEPLAVFDRATDS